MPLVMLTMKKKLHGFLFLCMDVVLFLLLWGSAIILGILFIYRMSKKSSPLGECASPFEFNVVISHARNACELCCWSVPNNEKRITRKAGNPVSRFTSKHFRWTNRWPWRTRLCCRGKNKNLQDLFIFCVYTFYRVKASTISPAMTFHLVHSRWQSVIHFWQEISKKRAWFMRPHQIVILHPLTTI